MALASVLVTYHRLCYEGVYHTNHCWLKGQHSSDCWWHDEWLAQVRMGLPSCYHTKLQAELRHNKFQDLGLGVAEWRRSANLGGFPSHFQKDEFSPELHQELIFDPAAGGHQWQLINDSSLKLQVRTRCRIHPTHGRLMIDDFYASLSSLVFWRPNPTTSPYHPECHPNLPHWLLKTWRSWHLVISIQRTSLTPCKNWASASLSFVVITLSADVWDSGHPTL